MVKLRFAGAVLALVVWSQVAQADVIGGSQITPSTSLSSVGPFVISQIADGITSDASPFNGFASNAAAGTITLGLDRLYDIGAFVIWNDINVFQEGIKDFRLDFFGASGNLLESSAVLVAPVGQVAPATYSFDTVSNVGSVNLVVLDSNPGIFQRIEIREVEFMTGTTNPVPEPSTWLLLGLGLGALAAMRRSEPR